MIRGLPEDGDVRNTHLFRETAPYIESISVNRYIWELLRLIPVWEEKQLHYQDDFETGNFNSAFTWANTPQGTGFWLPLYQEVNNNKQRG